MKTRYVRYSTLNQRKFPKDLEHVVVISPRSPRGSMWELYGTDKREHLQELFTDHIKYMEKHKRYDYHTIKFTGFALRERGIPIYKLALVFEDSADLETFISKSNFSIGELEEAEWVMQFGEARDLYLEGKMQQVKAAYHDLMIGQNLLWF